MVAWIESVLELPPNFFSSSTTASSQLVTKIILTQARDKHWRLTDDLHTHLVHNHAHLLSLDRLSLSDPEIIRWNDFYGKELDSTPIDPGLASGQDKPSVFGNTQPSITLTRRHGILKWMSDACSTIGWTYATFYVAVHAFDSYILSADHVIGKNDLGPLAAACLYYGAQLRESMADENVISLARFRQMCPEVGAPSVIHLQVAHLLDSLQGRSLGNRNPYDIIMLWLSKLGCADSNTESGMELGRLFDFLTNKELWRNVSFCLLQLANAFYLNGLCLCIPTSTLIAAGFLLILNTVAIKCKFPLSAVFDHNIAERICHYPGGLQALAPFCPIVAVIANDLLPNVNCGYDKRRFECKPTMMALSLAVAQAPSSKPNSPLVELARAQLLTAVRKASTAVRHSEACAVSEGHVFNPPISDRDRWRTRAASLSTEYTFIPTSPSARVGVSRRLVRPAEHRISATLPAGSANSLGQRLVRRYQTAENTWLTSPMKQTEERAEVRNCWNSNVKSEGIPELGNLHYRSGDRRYEGLSFHYHKNNALARRRSRDRVNQATT